MVWQPGESFNLHEYGLYENHYTSAAGCLGVAARRAAAHRPDRPPTPGNHLI